jgi:hypothetical protein
MWKSFYMLVLLLLTYLRSWAIPEKLPIMQPFMKFPAILTNPKVHHRVHNSTPLVPIRNQFDLVHTIPSYLRSILILSTHLSLGLPSGIIIIIIIIIIICCKSGYKLWRNPATDFP